MLKKTLVIIVLLLFAASAHGEGISTLAEMGKSQDAIAKDANEETEAYLKVKEAIEDGVIKVGDSQDAIARRYGEPVIATKDRQYAERWVYKPADASWFDGVKIYLFFDGDKNLAGVKMIKASPPAAPAAADE